MAVNLRVLIVEDNPMNRDMLERRLRLRGHEVLSAPDGETGLAAATEFRPDVVLMDVSLPGIDGWEATRRLKRNPDTDRIPVIALTAHALRQDEEHAKEVGCDGFHAKPVEIDSLLATMHSLAAGRK